ncbi:MAG: hypothetical protein ACRC5T_13235 [Cetobacterium sp.]
MKVILCMLIDKQGRIKYVPRYFKPNDVDICVSNFSMGEIGNKSLYYNLLEYDERYANDLCWTTSEVLRRCGEFKEDCTVKIFTRIQDFYDKADEIQFAFTDTLETYDEELSMEDLISYCKEMNKIALGEMQGVRFYRYTKKNIEK